MRLVKIGGVTTERKTASALSSKLIDAMRDRVIPLASMIETLPHKTRFVFTSEDLIESLLRDIQRDNPEILHNKDSFISEVVAAYDRVMHPVIP
jgi:hypothetical protein